MKLVTYRFHDVEQTGVFTPDEEHIYPLSAAGLSYATMLELIRRASREELALAAELAAKPLEAVPSAVARTASTLCAPIPHPDQDVICLGVNYASHAAESQRFHAGAFGGERARPIFFSKRVNRAVADGEAIPAHADMVDSLDYEVELAVIIGRDVCRVLPDDAAKYVFGYTVLNDVSARNVQTAHQQWYFGKSLDGFTPMGPCIATADEIPFPPLLSVTSTVNGELRQNSTTALLITGVAEIISVLSQGMTLRAGTIISTGTPSGVGMGFQPPKFLKPGDVVVCSVEGIGSLTNTVSE
jgi:2-keto-4-pentenoate hydratase/2-oxohepta-3-ene-1,7-dioic acid hydratase in catechol pathway